MKKISAEITQYMIDAITYTINTTVPNDFTKVELKSTALSLMKEYCEHANIEPDFTGIYYV